VISYRLVITNRRLWAGHGVSPCQSLGQQLLSLRRVAQDKCREAINHIPNCFEEYVACRRAVFSVKGGDIKSRQYEYSKCFLNNENNTTTTTTATTTTYNNNATRFCFNYRVLHPVARNINCK
jgi:hypothetical protein